MQYICVRIVAWTGAALGMAATVRAFTYSFSPRQDRDGTARLLWQIEILGELAIAMLLGAVVGFEREFAGKAAGLRTHMMVCAAAALLVALGEVMLVRFAEGGHKDLVETDPMRIVGAVITGVSFLGAGTIFRRHDGQQVEGLTTAASILLTAGIGMGVALRQWVLAIGAAVMVVLVLRGLVFIERWIAKNRAATPEGVATHDDSE